MAETISGGSGCTCGRADTLLEERAGSGFTGGFCGGLNITTMLTLDCTGSPSIMAGLKCQLLMARIAGSVNEGISRTGWTVCTAPDSSTVSSKTTAPIATVFTGYSMPAAEESSAA